MNGGAPVRALINGARGRMGAMICRMVERDSRFVLAAMRDAGDDDPPRDLTLDVIIDFSSDNGARDAAQLAYAHRAALLVGSTGLAPDTISMLDDVARAVAVMIAPNTSPGVAVAAHLAAEAARLLGPSFDIALIETHHVHKIDAPSGTALRLARALRERGGEAGKAFHEHRIVSVRVGEVVGEHELRFVGPGEQLTITHAAAGRELFARGALHAAHFLAHQPPGHYTIEQALGIARPEHDRDRA